MGASLAGVRVAEELRRLGYPGGITLVGAEPHLPYDRPPLSKGVLDGSVDAESLRLRTSSELDALGVDLILGATAAGLDNEAHEVVLETGDRLAYDALVVTTGAVPRFPAQLRGLEGVHQLRTVDDALALQETLTNCEHLALVGCGFIGAEVAATARQMGVEVTMLDLLQRPFAAVLGSEVGSHLEAMHRSWGVNFVSGVTVESFLGASRLEAIRHSGGGRIIADAALVGIGAVPAVDWLRDSDITLGNGVVCDEYGQACESVWAAGDVAQWADPMTGNLTRSEHWTNAVEQARTVAYNVLNTESGNRRSHKSVPYFWSDQYSSKIQCLGNPGVMTTSE